MKSFDKDVGWIDFEKEISYVLSCFEKALPENGRYIHVEDRAVNYVIGEFDFFIDKAAARNAVRIGSHSIKKEYCSEYPVASGVLVVNKKRIIDTLYIALQELSNGLKLYLRHFVERICEGYVYPLYEVTDIKPVLFNVDNAITFNYTNTFEKISHKRNQTIHLHGQLDRPIVLGVNSDDADVVGKVDTTFIAFKKYYQRAMCESDQNYLNWMSRIKADKVKYRLIIMGHSLDVTDKDILLEIFANAREIYVLFHNNEAKASYINNLVTLYGKEGFEGLRKEKALSFFPLNMDFTELISKMKKADSDCVVQVI